MYQVIYSSVVVWCAILTWLFTGRALTTIQWLAIIGTSVGLGISSLDSIRGGSPFQQDDDFAAAVAAAEGKIEGKEDLKGIIHVERLYLDSFYN